MKWIIYSISLLLVLAACDGTQQNKESELDYNNMVNLDAEALAEQGIKEAYDKLRKKLEKYIPRAVQIQELYNSDIPSYSIRYRNKQYDVYGPNMENSGGKPWGRATFIFFHIVNSQLENTNIRFYAINGGNELNGVFLEQKEYIKATKSLQNRNDWPYLPKNEYPWYGQEH
jgi:hypothetical protein